MKEFGHYNSSDRGAFIVDRRGTILAFDQGMEQLTGWPAVEIVGRRGAGGGTGQTETELLYDGEIAVPEGGGNLGLLVRRRDGRRLEAEIAAERLDGPGERILVSVLRVLSSSPGPTQLSGPVSRDRLTGLPDETAFLVALQEEFERSSRNARPFAMILTDIDHLREINDQLGQEAGDEVLQKTAGVIRAAVGNEAQLGRLGAEDFGILLPSSGRGEARQLAAGLRSTIERYRFFGIDSGSSDRNVTISLGAASFPADADTRLDLLERARDALNQARSMGRNRVWCYLRRPRVPLQVPVYFDGEESLLVGYTRDLSPSGIFVQTASPIEIGMRCALSFPLPGHESNIRVIARIVRTVPSDVAQVSRDTRIPGMGVEFERFGGSRDRRAIEGFLHRQESLTLRPESGLLSV